MNEIVVHHPLSPAIRQNPLQPVSRRLLNHPLRRAWTKDGLFDDYVQKRRSIDEYHAQANRFLESVATHNGFRQPLKLTVEQPPSCLDVEFAISDYENIYTRLNTELQQTTKGFADKFTRALDNEVRHGHIGIFQRFGADGCRYGYFQNVQVGPEEMQHQLFVHDVIHPRSHRIDAEIEMPNRAHFVRHAIPDWLKPEARIITGKQIREVRVGLEREQVAIPADDLITEAPKWKHAVAKPVYRRDPCIVLGDFWVLIGWNSSF